MESRLPTRWARAVAYLIDGGLAILTLMQVFSMTMYLSSLTAEDIEMFGEILLSSQARWCLVLAAFWLLVEVAQGHAYLRGAPSFGFAVTGLCLEGAERRPRLRRTARMLVPIGALFALARLYLTREDVMSTETIFVVAKTVAGGAWAAAMLLALIDAIVVLRDPSSRTPGDLLARATVASESPTGEVVRRALHVASVMTFASATLSLLATLESLNGEESFTHAFITPATMLGYMTSLASAWALATLYGATCERLAMRRRHPFVVAMLVALPFVSLLFLRGFVRRVADALGLTHDESMKLRGIVDLALAVQSAVTAIVLFDGAFVVRAQIETLITQVPTPPPLEPTVDPMYLAGASLFGTIAFAVALHRLSKLTYEHLLVAPASTDLEEVFA